MTIKSLVLFGFAAAILSLSACTTVEDEPTVRSTTTTTEERTIRQPVEQTTQTQTIRAY